MPRVRARRAWGQGAGASGKVSSSSALVVIHTCRAQRASLFREQWGGMGRWGLRGEGYQRYRPQKTAKPKPRMRGESRPTAQAPSQFRRLTAAQRGSNSILLSTSYTALADSRSFRRLPMHTGREPAAEPDAYPSRTAAPSFRDRLRAPRPPSW
jgi:hypothetical protein